MLGGSASGGPGGGPSKNPAKMKNIGGGYDGKIEKMFEGPTTVKMDRMDCLKHVFSKIKKIIIFCILFQPKYGRRGTPPGADPQLVKSLPPNILRNVINWPCNSCKSCLSSNSHLECIWVLTPSQNPFHN